MSENKKTGLIPVYTKEELSKVENLMLTGQQLDYILKKTPKDHLYKRPAKGGGEWTYVTGAYVKKTLNFLFGWDWDFEVVNFEVNMAAKQCIVHGKLTCRTAGKTIVKHQFGRSDIVFKTVPEFDANGNPVMKTGKNGEKYQSKVSGDEPLDLGNELKAASTDALKKCANELGLFSDVYSPDEYKEIKVLSDDAAASKDYWRRQISEAISLCQDIGVAEALRRDAIELDSNPETDISEYVKLYNRLVKQK